MRVSLRPGPGEEAVAEWTALSTVAFADQVARAAGACAARPVLIGVDGRSGGGKTTTALVLSDHLPEAQVLHTDDIAWYESMFGCDELLAAHVLRPLREGTTSTTALRLGTAADDQARCRPAPPAGT